MSTKKRSSSRKKSAKTPEAKTTGNDTFFSAKIPEVKTTGNDTFFLDTEYGKREARLINGKTYLKVKNSKDLWFAYPCVVKSVSFTLEDMRVLGRDGVQQKMAEAFASKT